MPPRSLWNGALVVALLNVPISVHSATSSKAIRFREVHAADGAQVEHRRVCPNDGEQVPYEHIVMGFEVAEGEYVEMSREELRAAAGPRSKRLEVEHFVRGEDIDPVFYDRAYHLGAREGGEMAYRLLYEGIRRSGKVGIARWVFHDRERLVAIRSRDGVLAMHTVRFHDEVLSGEALDVPQVQRAPTEREVETASMLVDALQANFDPARYRDTYRDAVMQVVERKVDGEPIVVEPPSGPEEAPDLIAALEASLAEGAGTGRSGERSPAGAGASGREARARR
jgi:DNA end-binding protein Ku